MATKLNIFADQGADYTLDISVKDTDGTATDLTSYTVNANFKKSYSTSQTHNFYETYNFWGNWWKMSRIRVSNTNIIIHTKS